MSASWDNALGLVEQQLDGLFALAKSPDPGDLPQACERLQAMGTQLLSWVDATAPANHPRSPQQRERLKQLLLRMQWVRTTILRRLAVADQAVQIVIPAPVDSTYTRSVPRAGGYGAYGNGPRGSGMMRGVTA